MPDVEVVMINWTRANNVARLIRKFREQSIPCVVTICDAGPIGEPLAADALAEADNVYTFTRNYGPFTRFIPAFNYNCRFTYFHDDDMLPGTRLIEHLLRHAADRPDSAMLGQIGRRIGRRYHARPVRRDPANCLPVDMLVRSYLIRTEFLVHIKQFRMLLGVEAPREDDMVAALAMRAYTDGAIYVTPQSGDREELCNCQELPAPYALSRTPNHYQKRDAFWRQGKELAAQIRRGASQQEVAIGVERSFGGESA